MFIVALPILFIIHFWSLKYTKRKALKFANFDAIERVVGKRLISKNWILLFVRSMILVFLIFSASGTVYWYTGLGSDLNYVLLVDASTSMLANDFDPNRIEAAKDSAKNFVDSLKGDDNMGVATFTGTTFVKQRLTVDQSDVKKAIDNIEIETIGGTAIGDAMVTVTNVLFEEDDNNVIILLTDGQSNVGIDPLDAVQFLNDKKVVVYPIGIGTVEGGNFVTTEVLSTLDEPTLRQLASDTGGTYFSANNENELSVAFNSVSGFKVKRLSENLSIPFMMAALFLLLIEWGLMNSKYRSLP